MIDTDHSLVLLFHFSAHSVILNFVEIRVGFFGATNNKNKFFSNVDLNWRKVSSIPKIDISQ